MSCILGVDRTYFLEFNFHIYDILKISSLM